MRMKMRTALSVLLAIAAFPALCHAQQGWPSKPIRVITPTSTGGTLDIIARPWADQMTRVTGQPWLVENRPGGLGIPGTLAAAKAAPDGYSFFLGSTENLVFAPRLVKDVGYDPVADFDLVAIVIDTTAFGVIAHKDLPANNLGELIALAKARPGKLTYAVTGGMADLVGQWLNKQTSTDVVQIIYKAIAQMTPDITGGRLDYVINALPPMETLVKSGKLKVLAVTSRSRLPGWENIETVGETVPGLFLAGFLALAAPAGTPPEIRERVNRETVAIVGSAAFTEKLATSGWHNARPARNVQETGEFVRAERERWHKILDGLGIKPK
jgi:tripartite-type tricarboxylate transporter receptor subunit TctC